MKYYYITCFDDIETGDASPKHYAYVLRVSESRNIVDALNRSDRYKYYLNGVWCESKRLAGNIFPTKKKALEVCRDWNNGFENNGTLFDKRYCRDVIIDC